MAARSRRSFAEKKAHASLAATCSVCLKCSLYRTIQIKSNHKFEVVEEQELLVRVPLPIAEVWAGMQAEAEEPTGKAGLQILRAILENEVTRRVGPPHRPNPTAGCVRWGKQPGYVVFGGQKIPLERPRVRTREGQEVELESYGQLQRDGKLQRVHGAAVARNVKRWREGDQPLRWTATGLLEAEKKFRRIKGYQEILLLKERRNP